MIGRVIFILHVTNNIFNNGSNLTSTEPGATDGNNLGGHQVYDRTHWNGRSPLSYVNITSPVRMVIIKHTGGGQCNSFHLCAAKVQTIQAQSVVQGYPDIPFSFLIGGDGNIYVGRGWDVQAAQRNDTIDIAFMGSYSFDTLTPTMTEAAQLLLEDGVARNKLRTNYILVAHNQTMATDSPGSNVYKEITTWPHYDGGLYFNRRLERSTGIRY